MGKISRAFVSLTLLSYASLGLGGWLESSPSVLSRSKGEEPCALVAAAQRKQLSEDKDAKTFHVTAELAYDCLLSVPFKKEDALRLIDGLYSFWHWQSTVDYLKDPPEGYLMPAVDLDEGIHHIRNKAAGNTYKNEFEFQQDLNSLVNSAHDGHFNLIFDTINIFTFQRKEMGPILSLSSDGKALPKVYSYNDLRGKANGAWKPSAIKSIDDEDAQKWLNRLSYKQCLQDPDALYNDLFFSLPAATQDLSGSFFSAIGLYTGPKTTIKFENGTKREFQNDASFHLSFDGVKNGDTFYEKFCSGDIKQAPMLKKREVELQKRSKAGKPRAGFPEPVVESNEGSIAGYFLEHNYSDTAVLSLSSFVPKDADKDDAAILRFSTVASTFLSASKQAGKAKLILDVTSNQGGAVFLGYDLFMQLFPAAKVTSAFNVRATEQINIIGSKVTRLLNDQKTKSSKAADSERDSIFDLNSYVNVKGEKFSSWDDYFGPETRDDINLTRLARWDLDNEDMTQKLGKLVVTGYGSRSKQPQQVFKPENIVLLTDGACASTCAVFADLLKQNGVKSIVIGGRPRLGSVQAVGGVKGSEVLTFKQLFGSAMYVFHNYSTPQEQRQLEATDLGEITRTGTYVLGRTVGDGNGGRINYRNAIRPDDEERVPRQFVYEPADCRIWHTPKTILNMTGLWTEVASTAWGEVRSGKQLPHVVAGAGSASPFASPWPRRCPLRYVVMEDVSWEKRPDREYAPTEDSYSVTRTVDGRPYFLALTDTAGQEEYRGLWAASNLKSDAFLLVYDITSGSSLEALDYFMDMIDVEAENRLENNQRLIKQLGKRSSGKEQVAVGMAPPVTIVAGNKCDLKDARVVSARQGLEWARRRGCGFMETSAREMVNIEETFALIVRRVVEARRIHYLQQFPPTLEALPSQTLSPPVERTTSQLIAHSHTPPLTAHEQALSDAVYQDTEHSPSQHKWLGMGRVLSRKIAKIRKSNEASALDTNAPAKQNSSSAGLSGDKISRPRPLKASSTGHNTNEGSPEDRRNKAYPSRRGANDHGEGNETQDPNKPSWWKLLDCSRT
ncbi:hypothetical protein PRK78_005885 [Emydomyces testavorans]|uniref:Tail specific protease domain-containing protein n=1 Tax=Emydomyces testavorans TaxID=2070801 RepID=A0AAF0IJZ0_9EURO|nr:hypothetical protein PRK78_005885 [Emydomyces testavorans]